MASKLLTKEEKEKMEEAFTLLWEIGLEVVELKKADDQQRISKVRIVDWETEVSDV